MSNNYFSKSTEIFISGLLPGYGQLNNSSDYAEVPAAFRVGFDGGDSGFRKRRFNR